MVNVMTKKKILTREYLDNLDIEPAVAKIMSRPMKIINEGKQFTVRIPAKFAKRAKIGDKDQLMFTLVSIDEKGNYTITAELKRNN